MVKMTKMGKVSRRGQHVRVRYPDWVSRGMMEPTGFRLIPTNHRESWESRIPKAPDGVFVKQSPIVS